MRTTAEQRADRAWGQGASQEPKPILLYDGGGSIAYKADNWQSVFTGLGTSRDKAVDSHFHRDPLLTVDTLEALYHDDDIAARIVETIVLEAMRQGYELNVRGDDEEQSAADAPDVAADMRDALDDLVAWDRIEETWIWGRLYGGSALLLGIDDGQEMKEPLNEDGIKTFTHMTAIDRRGITPLRYYSDPMHPKFGRPSSYILHPSGLVISSTALQGEEVHESRFILFGGVRASRRRRQQNDSWDFPVLQRSHTVLRQFHTSWQAIAHLVLDASQGVMKIKGLLSMIAGDQKEELQARMELTELGRSVARAMMMDAETESFERVATSFAGLPDVIDRMVHRLAGAARMPATILMGMSPGGLNATGESDMRWWYDSIRSDQGKVLEPALERVIELKFKSADGPTGGDEPEKWDTSFPPLWQQTREEESEIRLKTAQRDDIEIAAGIVTQEEVAVSRHGPEGYSIETTIDLEARKTLMEAQAAVPVTTEEEAKAAAALAAGTTRTPAEAEARPAEGDPEAVDPQTALNGAQVTALQELLLQLGDGKLPRASVVETITASFPFDRAQAERIVGDLGTTRFEAKKAEVPAAFGGPPTAVEDGAPWEKQPDGTFIDWTNGLYRDAHGKPIMEVPKQVLDRHDQEPLETGTLIDAHTHTWVVDEVVVESLTSKGSPHRHTVRFGQKENQVVSSSDSEAGAGHTSSPPFQKLPSDPTP